MRSFSTSEAKSGMRRELCYSTKKQCQVSCGILSHEEDKPQYIYRQVILDSPQLCAV